MSDEKKRIIELNASTSVANDEWLAKDGATNGTTKIQASKLKEIFQEGIEAGGVAYDNTTSGMRADDVQDAVDELASTKANSADLATVATSGSYNDLSDTPTIPSDASDIDYDNTESGLTATNVNDAIDEVLTEGAMIGSVGNLPASVASFIDGADDKPMKSLVAEITPVQDLHGYDNPWPGGSGKNLFDIDKWLNDSGATYTKSGNTYTITATSALFTTPFTFSDTDVAISASASSYVAGTATVIRMQLLDSNNRVVDELVANQSYQKREGLVASKVRFNWSTGGTFTITEPQIELGLTATSYAPYSNVCPISGHTEADVTRTGRNLYSATLADYSSTQVVEVGLATFYPVKVPYGTYTISTNAPTGYIWAGYNINDSSTLPRVYEGNPNTVTTDIIWVGLLTSDMSSAYAYNIMINQGSTVSEYEPYNGNTYTISFGSAGTVYGGTLDVVSGVLTVTNSYFVVDQNYSIGTGGYGMPFRIITPSNIKLIDDSSVLWGEECNMLTEVTQSSSWGAAATFSHTKNTYNIYFKITDEMTNIGELKTFLQSNPIQFVYKLATPQIIQLTPTQVKSLLGSNNVWADTGDIDKAEYVRDATTIINELIARIEALEG